jgi:hypothetical protein
MNYRQTKLGALTCSRQTDNRASSHTTGNHPIAAAAFVALAIPFLTIGCTTSEVEVSADLAEVSQAATACCTGSWQLLDGAVSIADLSAFSSFTAANGYPRPINNSGEILTYPQYRIGATARGGAGQTVVQQYIAYKYPGLNYCEFFTVFQDDFCPPQGGVLFIQPAPLPGAIGPTGSELGFLRSESDTNCSYSSACPNVTPGACWANEFRRSTVKEIWIR